MEDLPQETIEKLSRVTRPLKTQRSLPAKLEAVVAIVKRTIPNCDGAGVSLLVEGEPTSVAVSDRLTIEIDLVQYQTGQGPCLRQSATATSSASTSSSATAGSSASPRAPSTRHQQRVLVSP